MLRTKKYLPLSFLFVNIFCLQYYPIIHQNTLNFFIFNAQVSHRNRGARMIEPFAE